MLKHLLALLDLELACLILHAQRGRSRLASHEGGKGEPTISAAAGQQHRPSRMLIEVAADPLDRAVPLLAFVWVIRSRRGVRA